MNETVADSTARIKAKCEQYWNEQNISDSEARRESWRDVLADVRREASEGRAYDSRELADRIEAALARAESPERKAFVEAAIALCSRDCTLYNENTFMGGEAVIELMRTYRAMLAAEKKP